MSPATWRDPLTGAAYHASDGWLERVRRHLAAQLVHRVREREVATAALRVAQFWSREYLSHLFPLRFGLSVEESNPRPALFAHPTDRIDLAAYLPVPLRILPLDSDAVPPIYPDPQQGEQGWLLSDRLLTEAALLNLLLAQEPTVPDDQRHAARLAALTYPFHDELSARLGRWGHELVSLVGMALSGRPAALPAPLDAAVRAVRERNLDTLRVRMVMVTVKRIKHYVFETPGLNEIRGASTLLERVLGDMEEQVETEIGAELILRAGGGVLLFLAPAQSEPEAWPQRLRRAVHARAGTAQVAAASVEVPASLLLEDYPRALATLVHAVEAERAQAPVPLLATLPFETRCVLCQERAAEGWDSAPDGGAARPLCRPCRSKRQVGQRERRNVVVELLDELRIQSRLTTLGVKGTVEDGLASSLDELVPSGAKHPLIGTVYGDGNNIGAAMQQLRDMALARQWSTRLALTSRSAAALALGEATRRGAALRGWQPDSDPVLPKLPLQVLALGGDDLSLFAWAPVALYFATEFTRLTDLEFQPVEASRVPLTFSLGVLVSDGKTPVRKAVEVVSHDLLTWAKQAARARGYAGGTIALLASPTADGIPTDLERYRKQTFLLGAGRSLRLCTTLRPFSAAELARLLKTAEWVRTEGHLGRLQRLVATFYASRQSALLGLLHYAYQRGRYVSKAPRRGRATLDQDWLGALEKRLLSENTHEGSSLASPLLRYPVAPSRTPFGLPGTEASPLTWLSPLWDLLELAKLLGERSPDAPPPPDEEA